jgi:protein subunit release factor B
MTRQPERLLFSITIKDFDVETFTSGGPGGQNQNRVRSGVRLRHRPSGAVAESRETRDQLKNKRLAFLKIVENPKFKAWHRKEVARLLGQK